MTTLILVLGCVVQATQESEAVERELAAIQSLRLAGLHVETREPKSGPEGSNTAPSGDTIQHAFRLTIGETFSGDGRDCHLVRDLPWLSEIVLATPEVPDVIISRLKHPGRIRQLVIAGEGAKGPLPRSLTKLTGLKQATAFGEQVTDGRLVDFLEIMATVPGMSSLCVQSSSVTNDGVEGIARLRPQLTELDLSGKQITDDVGSSVERLSQLERLGLLDCSVSNAIISSIVKLRRLRELRLDIAISVASLQRLTAIPSLEHLRLHGTDTQFVHLPEFKGVRSVCLYGPATDRTLTALQGMDQLESVMIFGGKFTPEGLKRFREMRPELAFPGLFNEE